MHEYRIEEKGLTERGVVQDAYVLCIVFQKEGPGPRNGAQYGAPFREEDWDDDDDDDGDIDCMEIVPSALPPPLVSNQINPIEASSHVPKSQCIGTSESCLSDNNLSTYKVPAPAPINNDVPKESAQAADEGDICAWLDMFTEDETFVSSEENQNQKPDNNDANIEAPPSLDGVDIYNGLGDLGNLSAFGGGGYNFFAGDDAAYNLSGGFPNDNVPFLELLDLDAPLNCSAEAHESEIIRSEPYTDKNCYIPEHLSSQVNSCFSPSAMLPEAPPRLEDQLAASLKENNSWGNPKEDALNHGGAAYNIQTIISRK
ncbi:NAC domain-containing protein [Melia azedarach]|nr:NAC domain-containing protein [Melia azedarach]